MFQEFGLVSAAAYPATATESHYYMPHQAPALLFLGDYFGTLAAARCLGEHHVRVVLADARRMTRAGASKFVSERRLCPSTEDAAAWVAWLRESGTALRGAVLFPGSDEQVFLTALHGDVLSNHYQLPLRSLSRAMRILDKSKLSEACDKVGIEVPRTWFPKSTEALARDIAAIGERRVLIKPKTQAQWRSGEKAMHSETGESLSRDVTHFVQHSGYGPELLSHDADLAWPMLQEFLPQASAHILSVAGYASQRHPRAVLRASEKVLQRPRELGIGLCFESRPVPEGLDLKVAALCEELGYEGTFELEFVPHEGRLLLIDMNPRNYGQLGFEIARGAPLPYLEYLRATGDFATFDEVYARALAWNRTEPYAYAHGRLLHLVRAGQATAGRAQGLVPERWGAWAQSFGDRLVDASYRSDDPGPAAWDLLAHGAQFFKHPRSFLRSLSRTT